MSDDPLPSTVAEPAVPSRYPWYHWRQLGFNFLTISIIAHVFFGVVAAYLIVQAIPCKRKQAFAGQAASKAPARALEHKVQMQKKQQTMSMPTSKRVTTVGLSKVSLPTMPSMPSMNSAMTPMSMSGMSGASLGMSMGGGGTGGGNGGGAGLSLFGMRDPHGGALAGTFFDLKQTPDGRQTTMAKNGPDGRLTPEASKEYQDAVTGYVQGGMNDATLASRYFKGPNTLYSTQIYIPVMDAQEGPRAFNLAGRVKPSRWLVHYKGTVIAPESGTYHFVGVADDVLVVRFNNQVVLDCGSMFPSKHEPTRFFPFDGLGEMKGWFKGCGEGSQFTVEAGQKYPIDVLIGEWPGGEFRAYLQVLKDGVDYKKDSHGDPILPLFRTGTEQIAANGTGAPVYEHDGPVWKGVATPVAGLPSL